MLMTWKLLLALFFCHSLDKQCPLVPVSFTCSCLLAGKAYRSEMRKICLIFLNSFISVIDTSAFTEWLHTAM